MYNYDRTKIATETWKAMFVTAAKEPYEDLAQSDVRQQMYYYESTLRKDFQKLASGQYVKGEDTYETVGSMYTYGGWMSGFGWDRFASDKVAADMGPRGLAQAFKKSLTLNPAHFKEARLISADIERDFLVIMDLLKKGPWQGKLGNPNKVYEVLHKVYAQAGIVALLNKS